MGFLRWLVVAGPYSLAIIIRSDRQVGSLPWSIRINGPVSRVLALLRLSKLTRKLSVPSLIRLDCSRASDIFILVVSKRYNEI